MRFNKLILPFVIATNLAGCMPSNPPAPADNPFPAFVIPEESPEIYRDMLFYVDSSTVNSIASMISTHRASQSPDTVRSIILYDQIEPSEYELPIPVNIIISTDINTNHNSVARTAPISFENEALTVALEINGELDDDPFFDAYIMHESAHIAQYLAMIDKFKHADIPDHDIIYNLSIVSDWSYKNGYIAELRPVLAMCEAAGLSPSQASEFLALNPLCTLLDFSDPGWGSNLRYDEWARAVNEFYTKHSNVTN